MRHLTRLSVLTLTAIFAIAIQAEEIPFTIHTTGVISSSFVEDVYTEGPPSWWVPTEGVGGIPGWQEGSTVIGNITPTGAVVEDQILKLAFDIEGSTTSYDDDGLEEGRFDWVGSGIQAVDVDPANVIVDEEAGIIRQLFGTYRLLGEPLATTEITHVTGTFEQNPPVGEFVLYSSGWITTKIIPGMELVDNMFPPNPADPLQPGPLAWVYTTAGTGHYVPEPATFTGLLIGVVLLTRRRRWRSSNEPSAFQFQRTGR